MWTSYRDQASSVLTLGFGNGWNNKKFQVQLEYLKVILTLTCLKLEDERLKSLVDAVLKCKEIEEEKIHSAFSQANQL